MLELLERGGVVALGGGAVESERVREALARPRRRLVRRRRGGRLGARLAKRQAPAGRDRDEFARRFAARRPLYEEVARAILPSMRARGGQRPPRRWLAALRAPPGPAARLGAHAHRRDYPAVVGRRRGRSCSTAEGASFPAARWFCVADAPRSPRTATCCPPVEATIEVDGRRGARRRSPRPSGCSRELADAGARRDDGVLAFGGGVVGDLAGFCAATYQRGIAGRPGADDARRPGRLGLRRQDRGGPARGEELRRRLPPAARRARRPRRRSRRSRARSSRPASPRW